jgi:hypothetical protein
VLSAAEPPPGQRDKIEREAAEYAADPKDVRRHGRDPVTIPLSCIHSSYYQNIRALGVTSMVFVNAGLAALIASGPLAPEHAPEAATHTALFGARK